MSGDLDLPPKGYSKESQLARSNRRYTRKIASPKRWQAIADAKQSRCRVCDAPPPNELHHIIARSQGGSDTEANIAALCHDCHGLIERRDMFAVTKFLSSLDDSEYAYCIEHGGEDFFQRAYGLVYSRA